MIEDLNMVSMLMIVYDLIQFPLFFTFFSTVWPLIFFEWPLMLNWFNRPAVQNSVMVQPAPTNPFGNLPALPQMSIGPTGYSPSIQYGISSLPVSVLIWKYCCEQIWIWSICLICLIWLFFICNFDSSLILLWLWCLNRLLTNLLLLLLEYRHF